MNKLVDVVSTPPKRLRIGVILLGMLAATACQFSDTLALQNSTDQPLTIRLSVDEPFGYFDCAAGSGAQNAPQEGEILVELLPETTLCLQGPVTGVEEQYDARDYLTYLRVERAGALCFEADAASAGDRFVSDGALKTLVVDDVVCPGAIVVGSVPEATEQD